MNKMMDKYQALFAMTLIQDPNQPIKLVVQTRTLEGKLEEYSTMKEAIAASKKDLDIFKISPHIGLNSLRYIRCNREEIERCSNEFEYVKGLLPEGTPRNPEKDTRLYWVDYLDNNVRFIWTENSFAKRFSSI